MQKNQHSPEFIEQALNRARTRGSRTLESVATELNMSLGTLKGWLKRSRPVGAALPHAATLPGDVPAGQWTPVQRLLALNESHSLVGPALHAWCRVLPSRPGILRGCLPRRAKAGVARRHRNRVER